MRRALWFLALLLLPAAVVSAQLLTGSLATGPGGAVSNPVTSGQGGLGGDFSAQTGILYDAAGTFSAIPCTAGLLQGGAPPSCVTTISGLTSVTSTTFAGALTGNASTASALSPGRTINGVSFDGSANITVTVPIATGITGLGTGVATALAVNVGSVGAPVVNGGALGTPSSGVGTNLTGTAAGLTTGAASALAADPTDCVVGTIALGINAAGTAQCTATPSVSSFGVGVAAPAPVGDVLLIGRLLVNQNVTAIPAYVPTTPVEVFYSQAPDDSYAHITSDTFGVSGNRYTALKLRAARGTAAVPTATQSNNILGVYQFSGYGATNWRDGPYLIATAAEIWDDTKRGASLGIFTHALVTGVVGEAVRFNPDHSTDHGPNQIVLGAAVGTPDVGLIRSAAGVLKVTDASSGYGILDASGFRVSNVALAASHLSNGVSGTGAVCLVTNCTLIAPALGTPASGVATNLTGTAAGLTAGAATILATARNIAGQSFNGSSNITIASTDLSNTANIPLLNAANSFSASQTVSTSGNARYSIDAPSGNSSGINFNSGGGTIWSITRDATTTALTIAQPGLVAVSISTANVITLNTTNYNTCTALTTTAAVLGCTVSTEKVKDNITPSYVGLAAIRQLEPVLFTYRPDTVYGDGGKLHAGLSAENLQRASPLFVSLTNDVDKGGLLQPEPYAIQGAMVNAVKELAARLEALERR